MVPVLPGKCQVLYSFWEGWGLHEDLRCHDSSSAIGLDPRLGKQEEIVVGVYGK